MRVYELIEVGALVSEQRTDDTTDSNKNKDRKLEDTVNEKSPVHFNFFFGSPCRAPASRVGTQCLIH